MNRDSTKPTWYRDLPAHIPLSNYQVERLELIRSYSNIPESDFRLHIISHPECTKMLQRVLFRQMKQDDPSMPDELALVMIVYHRLLSALMTGGDLFGLGVRFPVASPEEPPARLIEAIVDLIRSRSYRTIDDVAGAIVAEEANLPKNVPTAPEFKQVAAQITLILKESVQR